MKQRLGLRRVQGFGEVLLLVYLAAVLVVAVGRLVVGWPVVSSLASSPALLWHGEWWRLATSALVVQGPAVPQIIAIGVLGSLGIYFGGSWLFWRTAAFGHVLGTLTSYAWFGSWWLIDKAAAARWLVAPDYGVSLVWSAALGAFAGWAWMGERGDVRRPVRPWWVLVALVALVVVEHYSDDMAALQHAVAFGVGVVIMATAGRARRLARGRRPLVSRVAVRS